MASIEFTNDELEQKFGRRPAGVELLFEAWEFGYRCPQLHHGECIRFSKFNDYVWCEQCGVDWPSADCPIQRPSWMEDGRFDEFLDALPFTPSLLAGIDNLEGGQDE